MIYLGIIVILFILIFNLLIGKNVFSPVVMFSSLFAFILILALLRLNGIRQYSNGAVYSIELGVIFFALGALIVRFLFENLKTKEKNQHFSEKLEINDFFVTLLTVLVTIGTIITMVYVGKMLLSGGVYAEIRGSILGYNDNEALISNKWLHGFVTYFCSPGLYAITPITIYFFVKRERLFFCTIVLINIILNSVITGGRIFLVYASIQFFATLSYSNIKISKRTKRVIVALVFFAIIAVLLISNARSSRGILSVIYAYFSGPVVLLSEWQQVLDNSNTLTYGLSFFYPFTYGINTILNLLGVSSDILNNAVSLQGAPQDTWVSVFPNMSMNAFVTVFYFFYQDLRYFGICLFSMIYGMICHFIYHKAYIEKNNKFFIMYLLFIKGIVGAFILWQLGSTSFFVSFVLLLFCLLEKPSKKRYRN